MEELQEVSRPVMERAVQMWQPKKFFSFYLSSLKYLAHTGYNFVRIAIPSAAAAVVWAVLTAIRVVVLFFSMIILIVGPKIGLPRAIYQSTWKVLVKMGCVSPQNIMRAGADAAAAAASSENPELSGLTGALVRVGYQNTDIILVSQMVTHTAGAIISEIFWATVDVLGIGGYFRNVARHKKDLEERDRRRLERASSINPDEDEDEGIEEAYTEDTESGEGITVARALYTVQKGSEWSVGQAQKWWTGSRQKKERLKREADEKKAKRDRENAERSLVYAEETLFDSEAALSFSQEIAAEAQEDANRCNEDVHLAEKAYEAALGSGVGVGEAEERLVFANREAVDALEWLKSKESEREEAASDLKDAQDEVCALRKKVEQMKETERRREEGRALEREIEESRARAGGSETRAASARVEDMSGSSGGGSSVDVERLGAGSVGSDESSGDVEKLRGDSSRLTSGDGQDSDEDVEEVYSEEWVGGGRTRVDACRADDADTGDQEVMDQGASGGGETSEGG